MAGIDFAFLPPRSFDTVSFLAFAVLAAGTLTPFLFAAFYSDLLLELSPISDSSSFMDFVWPLPGTEFIETKLEDEPELELETLDELLLSSTIF